MKASLIIPCFNEAKNLHLLVERCARLISLSADVEVILVDNGSTDDTPKVMASLIESETKISFTRVDVNQGYGYGILAGLSVAKGDVMAWTHADMQTDPLDLIQGLEFFKESAKPDELFVKGLRYGRPIADRIFTFGMSMFETIWMSKLLRDINAQPTMFHRSFYESFSNPPHDFSLDLFTYYKAKRDGLEVRRFPVRFGERAHGVSHWNVDYKAKLKFIKRTIGYSIDLKKELANPK